MSGSLALHALGDDDDFASAEGDPFEEDTRYEFLDVLSVASLGPTTERTRAIIVQLQGSLL